MSSITPDPASFLFGLPQQDAPLLSSLLRALFEADARTHITADPTQPSAPKPGMMRVLLAPTFPTDPTIDLEAYLEVGGVEQWVKVLRNLHLGVPVARTLKVEFATAAATWTVVHNLAKDVIWQVFDTAGNKLDAATEKVVDANTVEVTHSIATAGFVIVVG